MKWGIRSATIFLSGLLLGMGIYLIKENVFLGGGSIILAFVMGLIGIFSE